MDGYECYFQYASIRMRSYERRRETSRKGYRYLFAHSEITMYYSIHNSCASACCSSLSLSLAPYLFRVQSLTSILYQFWIHFLFSTVYMRIIACMNAVQLSCSLFYSQWLNKSICLRTDVYISIRALCEPNFRPYAPITDSTKRWEKKVLWRSLVDCRCAKFSECQLFPIALCEWLLRFAQKIYESAANSCSHRQTNGAHPLPKRNGFTMAFQFDFEWFFFLHFREIDLDSFLLLNICANTVLSWSFFSSMSLSYRTLSKRLYQKEISTP